MSWPWLLCKVRRHTSVTVQFLTESGQLETWERCALPLSELLQHEVDHLDGRLIVDIAEGGGHGIVSRDEFERDPARFHREADYFIQPTV
jgi:peptide deformylase